MQDLTPGLGFCTQVLDQLEDAADLFAAPGHQPVARLRPANPALAVHDDRRAVGDVEHRWDEAGWPPA